MTENIIDDMRSIYEKLLNPQFWAYTEGINIARAIRAQHPELVEFLFPVPEPEDNEIDEREQQAADEQEAADRAREQMEDSQEQENINDQDFIAAGEGLDDQDKEDNNGPEDTRQDSTGP